MCFQLIRVGISWNKTYSLKDALPSLSFSPYFSLSFPPSPFFSLYSLIFIPLYFACRLSFNSSMKKTQNFKTQNKNKKDPNQIKSKAKNSTSNQTQEVWIWQPCLLQWCKHIMVVTETSTICTYSLFCTLYNKNFLSKLGWKYSIAAIFLQSVLQLFFPLRQVFKGTGRQIWNFLTSCMFHMYGWKLWLCNFWGHSIKCAVVREKGGMSLLITGSVPRT